MDWLLAFAQRAHKGDSEALSRLNAWLADWCESNPPYLGPNWKCGQEAALRVMQLAVAAQMLGDVKQTTPGLMDLLRVHLQRIEPTLQYAMAQDNNHGTSEAAALFIGGSWLAGAGVTEAVRWQDKGRYWLENRAGRLIGDQGSFSQYSLNYHRVMLDTFCIVEVWRRENRLPRFSDHFETRAREAARWLHDMVSPTSGDGPNLGANDGARLLQLADTAYRDYRPTVQLAMAVFAGQCAYKEDGPWNHVLHWLGVRTPEECAPGPSSRVADDGGFAVLRRRDAMAMLRYPRFRFRPSQADALHLDFWVDGENLLRDGGTFSYNADQRWLNYFAGTASHNTVQFDDRDQMPRLSRFLFCDWLKTTKVAQLEVGQLTSTFSASYIDRLKASHSRHVNLADSHLQVIDEIAGFAHKAVLRWRIAPGNWQLDGHRLTNGACSLAVRASVPIVRLELVEGWESRHYLEKAPVPVLEIEVTQPGTLTTEFRWTV
ncbi:heparinase II/III domain-containing protein [Cupriavidus sp. TMH.W2]|uniref:heparinase II/III family protein n=1 Tax=Cupriavidus sp. TMH.W2 TaxID=3434465 RepID=UPI003D78506F